MAEQLTREQIAQHADIHIDAPRVAAPVDRTFELPKGLYIGTVGLYLGFIAMLAVTFAHPELTILAVIFALSVIAGFGLPLVWTRLAPQTKSKSKTWGRFQQEGVMTASGRASARDATVQVMILPVLIFLWGVCVVAIAALV
ncbi:hypothetical protein OZN62_13095 [Aurantiacibacter sp. MUD11]|uniref:hypothetical protein n=1 Tax=Aurantiacibacter sp. MUD11 TaxID=3003265 RepID=UPI0022AB0102|nr:hypothetical protein [Aurantiacibacter sp. MUD11]WAT17833.1 hypothetical protein OZN62_13095 [Aurantiacibacter sp. MUD11]